MTWVSSSLREPSRPINGWDSCASLDAAETSAPCISQAAASTETTRLTIEKSLTFSAALWNAPSSKQIARNRLIWPLAKNSAPSKVSNVTYEARTESFDKNKQNKSDRFNASAITVELRRPASNVAESNSKVPGLSRSATPSTKPLSFDECDRKARIRKCSRLSALRRRIVPHSRGEVRFGWRAKHRHGYGLTP